MAESSGAKKNRLPTARDTRLREAMLALLTEGSSRKAAAKTGIPYRTIAVWAASDEGRRTIDELKSSVGAQLADRFVHIVGEMLDQYHAALREGKIAPAQLPIHIGIFTDKAARLAPSRHEGESGDVVVEVKFGGVRAPSGGQVIDAIPLEDSDDEGGSVTVRARR